MSGFIGLVQLNQEPWKLEEFDNLCTAALARDACRIDPPLSSASNFVLAPLRLPILTPAAPPAVSSDGKLHLYLEGEVYNDDFPPRSQAEALMQAYQREGSDLFKRLNGHFLLALAQPEIGRLILVADRTASVPLFYLRCGDVLAFSPILRPLLSLTGFTPRINALAVSNFLSTGCILEGKCLVDGIELLRQGQVLEVQERDVQVSNYWEFRYAEQRDQRPEEILATELTDLVFQAVERHTRNDAGIAISLSGGYDSRSILSVMRHLYPDRPIQTITWGHPSGHPQSDVAVAERLARHFKTEHSFFALNPATLPDHFRNFVLASEGRIDAVGNYPHALSILERIHTDLGVDLIIRGNEFFGCKAKVSRLSAALYNAYLPTLSFLPQSYRYLRESTHRQLNDIGEAQAARLAARYPYPDLTDCKDNLFIAERFFGYQNPLTQLKSRVLKECNPLLDNNLIDFVSRLPSPLRVWKKLFKTTVHCIMPEMDKIGLSRFNNLIDWDSRIRSDGNLQAFIRVILLGSDNSLNQIVDAEALRLFLEDAFKPRLIAPRTRTSTLLRKLRHRLNRYDIPASEEIFRLMILKIWVDDCLSGNFDLV
jgi:asparagine synthase (glutamine-hydrolysing)